LIATYQLQPGRVRDGEPDTNPKDIKMRSLLVAALLAVALVAGVVGYALADIPDSRPSLADPEHTFYGCVSPNGTGTNGQIHPFTALDKSLGNCPANYTEVRLVPSALP
jgi:hypothetical protein